MLIFCLITLISSAPVKLNPKADEIPPTEVPLDISRSFKFSNSNDEKLVLPQCPNSLLVSSTGIADKKLTQS